MMNGTENITLMVIEKKTSKASPPGDWRALNRWLLGFTIWGVLLLVGRNLWLGLNGYAHPVSVSNGLPFALTYAFLPWNLLLGWISYAIIQVLDRRGAPRVFQWTYLPLWVLWLLFLPNAPYLLTDFIHLRPRPGVPLWFDAGLLTTFAALGWAFGILSVYRAVQLFRSFLSKNKARLFAASILFLSSIGVFLGRELRWNSWDALLRPQQVLESGLLLFINPMQYAEAWLMCVVLFGMLLFSYGGLESLLGLKKRGNA